MVRHHVRGSPSRRTIHARPACPSTAWDASGSWKAGRTSSACSTRNCSTFPNMICNRDRRPEAGHLPGGDGRRQRLADRASSTIGCSSSTPMRAGSPLYSLLTGLRGQPSFRQIADGTLWMLEASSKKLASLDVTDEFGGERPRRREPTATAQPSATTIPKPTTTPGFLALLPIVALSLALYLGRARK